MLNSLEYSHRNCPKELTNILKDEWNRFLFASLSCFDLSTCSVIQVGSMLSSQRLNKVMAEVGKKFHETAAKEIRKISPPVSFCQHQDQFWPVLSVTKRYSFGRGVLDSLFRKHNFARQRASGNWTGLHQAWKKKRGKTQEAKSLLLPRLLPNWSIKELVCSDWLSTYMLRKLL